MIIPATPHGWSLTEIIHESQQQPISRSRHYQLVQSTQASRPRGEEVVPGNGYTILCDERWQDRGPQSRPKAPESRSKFDAKQTDHAIAATVGEAIEARQAGYRCLIQFDPACWAFLAPPHTMRIRVTPCNHRQDCALCTMTWSMDKSLPSP